MKYIAFLLLPLGLLAGCANPNLAAGVAAGTPRDQVVARAGPPTAVVTLPGGAERLQYSIQPLGRYAYMVDMDAGGRVAQVRQVLTDAEFNRIQFDRWTRADIEREFGPPAQDDTVTSWNGRVLTYRWTNGTDMFYYIYVDPQGVVRSASAAMELYNAPIRD